MGASKREPGVFTAQGFGRFFPFVIIKVGKRDGLFPCLYVFELGLPTDAEKRGKTISDFSAKNRIFGQGEFRISFSTHEGSKQYFPGRSSSWK